MVLRVDGTQLCCSHLGSLVQFQSGGGLVDSHLKAHLGYIHVPDGALTGLPGDAGCQLDLPTGTPHGLSTGLGPSHSTRAGSQRAVPRASFPGDPGSSCKASHDLALDIISPASTGQSVTVGT